MRAYTPTHEPRVPTARRATTARIKFDGEFTATELEEMIQFLAAKRSELDPPVPMDPPWSTEDDRGRPPVVPRLAFMTHTLRERETLLSFRSAGHGWLSFSVPNMILSDECLSRCLGQSKS